MPRKPRYLQNHLVCQKEKGLIKHYIDSAQHKFSRYYKKITSQLVFHLNIGIIQLHLRLQLFLSSLLNWPKMHSFSRPPHFVTASVSFGLHFLLHLTEHLSDLPPLDSMLEMVPSMLPMLDMGSILFTLDRDFIISILVSYGISMLETLLFIVAASAMPLMAKAKKVNKVNRSCSMIGKGCPLRSIRRLVLRLAQRQKYILEQHPPCSMLLQF